MELSRRLFRLLLLAYPPQVRKTNGLDMWLTFENHLRDARAHGMRAVLTLWGREIVAVWQAGRQARVSARQSARAHRRRNPRRVRDHLTLGRWSLDFKLGLRMLVKYPGLSIVSVVGIAVAIAIGAGSFGVIHAMMDPTLPLDEGDRVIAIQEWDSRIGNPNRQSLHDFSEWRNTLETVVDLAAYRTTTANLFALDGTVEPIRIAEMTASGFRVARVQPLKGRYLVDEDESVAAPNVVVIGYDAWQYRFAGDAAIVGRTLQIDNTAYAVIGVMPRDFAFPVNYRYWTPMRLDPSDWDRGDGPSITMFGRLAPAASLSDARAELRAVGERQAATYPDSHGSRQPYVLPYTYPFFDIDTPGIAMQFHMAQLIISLLLVVVGVNVAILVYARTATRSGEIAVRKALGASRGRIVGQLFVEALVLCGAAAIVGTTLTAIALGRINAAIERIAGEQFPFWLDFNVSPGTVVYVSIVAVLAAAIVGIIPAATITGRGVQARLQRLASSGVRTQLGGTWTFLIVAQVAVAVAVLPAAVFYGQATIAAGFENPGFEADEYLSAWLSMDRKTPTTQEAESYQHEFETRFAARHVELDRRLRNDPAVASIAFAQRKIGQEYMARVEVDGLPTADATPDDAVRSSSTGLPVWFNEVSTDYFEAFDLPMLAGRSFGLADTDTAAAAVVVNRAFVNAYLNGGNAVGHRVRYVGSDVTLERWYEIVGVVPDFPRASSGGAPKLYKPVATGALYPAGLVIRVQGSDPGAFVPQLRQIAAAVDPALRLNEVLPVSEDYAQQRRFSLLAAIAICLITLSVLLLSAGGIYSLMSFTVTQRRREIGIRTALGADGRNILIGIFRRAVLQLAAGVAVGAFLAQLIDMGSGGELMDGEGVLILPLVSLLMILVGLFAALGPARRGLQVPPSEALRGAD